MHQLLIKDIECHAFHGCMEEEGKIGGRFSVDVEINGDFSAAVSNDDLSATVDYVAVHRIVRREMSVRSKLIEHVAGRILQQMKNTFPEVTSCAVTITKYNPPVNGQIGRAVFTVRG